MAEGCKEKFDLQFVRWILLGGRSAEKRRRYRNILEKYPEKTVVIKNQRELDRFYLNFLLAQSAGIHRPAAEP